LPFLLLGLVLVMLLECIHLAVEAAGGFTATQKFSRRGASCLCSSLLLSAEQPPPPATRRRATELVSQTALRTRRIRIKKNMGNGEQEGRWRGGENGPCQVGLCQRRDIREPRAGGVELEQLTELGGQGAPLSPQADAFLAITHGRW
jgi:hypothetical protein